MPQISKIIILNLNCEPILRCDCRVESSILARRLFNFSRVKLHICVGELNELAVDVDTECLI